MINLVKNAVDRDSDLQNLIRGERPYINFYSDIFLLKDGKALNSITQRFIRCNIYSFQIFILLAFSQTRIEKNIAYHIIGIFLAFYKNKTQYKICYNSIKNLWFQIEMTLRHKNITEMHLT